VPPADGATELELDLEVSLFRGPGLVDGARSDRVIISQQVPRKSEAVWYWASSRSFVAPPFTQSLGELAHIQGEFKELAQEKSTLTWDQPAFADLAPQVHPAALAVGQFLMFKADPAGPGRATLWDVPSFLLAYSDGPTDGSATLNMELISGNPFPAKWRRLVDVTTEFHLPWLPEWLGVGIGSVLPHDEAVKGPLVPAITPARRLRVAGQDATGAVSGTGLSPTIEWQAPARGKASAYFLDVFQQNPAGELELAGVLITELTRVTIPPDVLKPDAPYLMRLTALAGRQVNRPNRAVGERFGYADVVTGMLVP
jgi:hypothetical protein